MDEQHDHITLSEARFYTNGWVLRLGIFLLRWNRQTNYSALSIEWVRHDFRQCGGLTWRNFRLARKQAAEARKQAAEERQRYSS